MALLTIGQFSTFNIGLAPLRPPNNNLFLLLCLLWHNVPECGQYYNVPHTIMRIHVLHKEFSIPLCWLCTVKSETGLVRTPVFILSIYIFCALLCEGGSLCVMPKALTEPYEERYMVAAVLQFAWRQFSCSLQAPSTSTSQTSGRGG